MEQPARPSRGSPGQATIPEFQPVVIDRPIMEFEPKPSAYDIEYRPDFLCDGWSSDTATIRLASVRGYSHRYGGIPRQDDAVVVAHPRTGAVVFAVADGVSSAPYAHIGAASACRTVVRLLLRQLDSGTAPDWTEAIGDTAWHLVEYASRLPGVDGRDSAATARLLATTLVAGVVTPAGDRLKAEAVQIGDSGAWLLDSCGYRPVLGRKTSDGDVVVSNAVNPLPRVPAEVLPQRFSVTRGEVLLVGTDGFGDPLGDGQGQVGQLFDRFLSRSSWPSPLEFAHVLDFSRETFDDDRTLLAIRPRPSVRGKAQ
ncbi:protein phosphatase 2C domain-containing protein [Streptomyces sp. UNOB3_S3]|uniref:protein phosphatase 2C domain-containing protein n=1 Tax=Streptomyces sp. UNOB3_S3 TaxID=2871682 RepID=UPI001E62ED67|nr:protein phosphatase 2C domain-containing protein [Streptomyces sp. UNOB3_S3]MCC3779372.1 protein phosphatase 2C domain-containing protein [Streptomyces sp. UNOB3_S3]